MSLGHAPASEWTVAPHHPCRVGHDLCYGPESPRSFCRALGLSAGGRVLIVSTDKFTWGQLDAEASSRREQPSFHIFAEGAHSDVRGQIYNLGAGEMLSLPHDRWPRHVFVLTGLAGTADVEVAGRTLSLVALSQLLVLPGVPCRVKAHSGASFQLLSFLSTTPLARSDD